MTGTAAPILIVDDDVEDQIILNDYFAEFELNHYIQFASNGQLALDLLEQLPDDKLPQLIVLDLNMPIMNGIQTLLHLKKQNRYKEIPIIIFSTAENENEKNKCLNFGAYDYLVKPSTYDSGLKIVQYLQSLVKSQ